MPQAPSPNMLIVWPTDNDDLNVWAPIMDTAVRSVIDGHDHTTGKGVKIGAAALNINADVSWSSGGVSHALTDLLAIDFKPVNPATISGLAGAFYISDGTSGVLNELYYRTMLGSNVQVTLGAALNVAAFAGGIGGDYIASGALEVYDAATLSYWLQQPGSPRPWASLRVGNVDIYQAAASIVNRVRLQSPNALAASYAVTLPTALPAAKSLMQVDSTGAITVAASNTQTYSMAFAAPGPIANAGFPTATLNVTQFLPLYLRVGETITGWSFSFSKATNATFTVSAQLWDLTIATEATAQIGATQSSSAAGVVFLTVSASGLSSVVVTGHSYFLLVFSTGTGDNAVAYSVTT